MIKHNGFTIVELVVIIAVIGILATLATFGINKYMTDAQDSSRESGVTTIANALEKYFQEHGEYPGCDAITADGATVVRDTLKGLDASALITPGAESGTTNSIRCGESIESSTEDFYEYIGDGTAGCNGSGACATYTLKYQKEGEDSVIEVKATRTASLGPTNGAIIQTITSADCPSTRIRAVDARDNKTYWVQKLADNKCWMLTNLAYAGGGTNTYGDTKTLTDGTSSASTFTVASYYVPTTGSNVTTEPTNPSASTTGGGQVGYLYNWCGAMGGQATAACANSSVPAVVSTTTICPAGWRLPSISGTSEFAALNTAVNSGSTTSDAGLLTTWLGQRGAGWANGYFGTQGNDGYYWAGDSSAPGNANRMSFNSTSVVPNSSTAKHAGQAIRCVAV